MASPPNLHDVACVVHLHSTYSDGTGTVPEIAAAGRRAGVEAVLLTDHDSLEAKRRGEERWWGSVLVLVGTEVTPRDQNHYLAFGIEEEIDPGGLSASGVCAAVEEAGGFGFAAHPFSRGSDRFRRMGPGYPWRDLACEGLAGLELWSFVTDTAERLRGLRDAGRFIVRPERAVDHPPPENVAQWDRLCAERRMAAIGGLDAHQFGIRIRGRVPLRLMAYHRSFRHLRTHALCERPLRGELRPDREGIYAALREGRCFLAMDSLAPARGFSFWGSRRGDVVPMGAEEGAGDWTLRARSPRPAALRLVRDGETVARTSGRELDARADVPGAYRVEARLEAFGRERTWIVSNPIYLR